VLPRSDEALFRRLLDKDLTAFDALYERHAQPLFGFIRQQLGAEASAEAEDVLHEAFLAVLRQREAAASTVSFRAWLFQVARHLCLNRARTRRRAARATDAVAAGAAQGEASDPGQALDRHQRTARLEAAVEQLPEPLGALYRLRASGLSYQELAQVLGVPLGTVKSRMHELVSRLQEEVPS
jgi:RNA polymerase sigma-70 factor, ECF subfamily